MSLTAEAANELRKPFERKSIGKLPKPYKAESLKGNCPECGGYHGLPAAHLDYVGHAAVTDRLLAVDPTWSWEPLAVDDRGLPALDVKGNLWIRLTVCGVTRIGVGDGKSAKEVIGDAIRNAAMRFGVALDLWGKEELEQAHEPAQRAMPTPAAPITAAAITAAPVVITATPQSRGGEAPPASPPSAVEDDPPSPPRPALNPRLRGKMFALFNQVLDVDEKTPEGRQIRLDYIHRAIGHPVTTSNDLTPVEAGVVVQMLEADIERSAS